MGKGIKKRASYENRGRVVALHHRWWALPFLSLCSFEYFPVSMFSEFITMVLNACRVVSAGSHCPSLPTPSPAKPFIYAIYAIYAKYMATKDWNQPRLLCHLIHCVFKPFSESKPVDSSMNLINWSILEPGRFSRITTILQIE